MDYNELVQLIADEWRMFCDADSTIAGIAPLIEAGTATYAQAHDYAVRSGEILYGIIQRYAGAITDDNGKLLYDAAEGLLKPLTYMDADSVADICADIQDCINRSADISLKALRVAPDNYRVAGILENAAEAEVFVDSDYGENLVTMGKNLVNESVKRNASFQDEVGLEAVIVRKLGPEAVGIDKRGRKYAIPCKLCKGDAEGSPYRYRDAPDEVFMCHSGCRCVVDYVVGKSQTNVWTKAMTMNE